MNNNIFLLLGTNMGNRIDNLEQARQRIGAIGQIITISSIYQTEAWGNTNQPPFYNQVIEIDTAVKPDVLLEKILSIETSLGRERKEKWGPRIIDIDILFYQDKIIYHENLTIPHPGIPVRRFTLLPMHEIAPQFRHPVLDKTIAVLLELCTDTLAAEQVDQPKFKSRIP